MYFDRKCKITFICHGATIYSDEFRFSDVENYPPLSDAGQEEMEKIFTPSGFFLRKRLFFPIECGIIQKNPAKRRKLWPLLRISALPSTASTGRMWCIT